MRVSIVLLIAALLVVLRGASIKISTVASVVSAVVDLSSLLLLLLEVWLLSFSWSGFSAR